MSLFLCYFNDHIVDHRLKPILIFFCFFIISLQSHAQEKQTYPETHNKVQDSTKKSSLIQSLNSGYFKTKYFNFDLRYLIKYNQFEGFRTGLGGITNEDFSKKYRLQGYTVYGFLDHTFKYNYGGGFRIAPKTNTWISLAYTSDLQETGSSTFLTDKRFFQLFEPRLINISLFHKHVTKALAIEHMFSPKLLTETQFSNTEITPTYDYAFNRGDKSFENYVLSLAKVSLQWNPFDSIEIDNEGHSKIGTDGYPKFTIQFTKSFKGIMDSDFNFSKLDFRVIQHLKHPNKSLTEMVLTTGIVSNDTPITHLYHAYPNNVNKETILNRFSVAGNNSFETMYFNEFFSDKFATLIIKHKLKPFNISPRFKPQLVLLNKFAFGSLDNPERHENISFSTLDKGFTESGIEINNLLFGFGLSFAYRYGAYHLPKIEDNMALKFTFNLSLD